VERPPRAAPSREAAAAAVARADRPACEEEAPMNWPDALVFAALAATVVLVVGLPS
jgi:hypothetical protein